MIAGFLKPVLVLPPEQYGGEELYFILKHELIHFKRRDVWFKLLLMLANALHWFNPLIWLMHREAVVDMELACDERVVQGKGYRIRKAYTETLFSTLNGRKTAGTTLSTQFYGGKMIMKKRFRNILKMNRKKNGILVLTGVILLMAGMGAMVGCSVAADNPEPVSPVAMDDSAQDRMTAEGYGGMDESGYTADAETDAGSGSQLDGSEWFRTEKDMVHMITLKEAGEEVWQIICSFPVEAQEGWGQTLRVMAASFAAD